MNKKGPKSVKLKILGVVLIAEVGRRTVRRCAVGVYNCRLPGPQSLDSLLGQTSSEWIRFKRHQAASS